MFLVIPKIDVVICLNICNTDKVMDAVEVAERRSIAATSNVVAGAVSKR